MAGINDHNGFFYEVLSDFPIWGIFKPTSFGSENDTCELRLDQLSNS